MSRLTLIVSALVAAVALAGCAKPGERKPETGSTGTASHQASKQNDKPKSEHKSHLPQLPIGPKKAEMVNADATQACLLEHAGGMVEISRGSTDPDGNAIAGDVLTLTFPSDGAKEQYGRDKNIGEEDDYSDVEPEYVASELTVYILGDEDAAKQLSREVFSNYGVQSSERRRNAVVSAGALPTPPQDELLNACLPADTMDADRNADTDQEAK